MSNSANIFWNSFSFEEKKCFLKEHRLPNVEAATNAMNFANRNSATCMICVVEALGNDAPIQNADLLLQIINRTVGKEFMKPAKQKRHNQSKKHTAGHFCNSKFSVAKALESWIHGLIPYWRGLSDGF